MFLIRIALCTTLLLSATFAASEAPLDIGGLNTQLHLDEAIAHAQTLGGRCSATPPSRKVGGKRTQCHFSDCEETAPGANCERNGIPNSSFELAGQPVVSIELEASADDAPLTTIALFYAGDHQILVTQLLEQFGPPTADTATNQKSWTEARRMMWRAGVHRLSLLDNPKLILMVAERESAKK